MSYFCKIYHCAISGNSVLTVIISVHWNIFMNIIWPAVSLVRWFKYGVGKLGNILKLSAVRSSPWWFSKGLWQWVIHYTAVILKIVNYVSRDVCVFQSTRRGQQVPDCNTTAATLTAINVDTMPANVEHVSENFVNHLTCLSFSFSKETG
jgi:hypothetical protein